MLRFVFGVLVGALLATGCENASTPARETRTDSTGRMKVNAPGVNVDIERQRDDKGVKVDVDVNRKKD